MGLETVVVAEVAAVVVVVAVAVVVVVVVVVVFVFDDIAEELSVPEPPVPLLVDSGVPPLLWAVSAVPAVAAEELSVPVDGKKDTLGRCRVTVTVPLPVIAVRGVVRPHETSKKSRGKHCAHAMIRFMHPPPFGDRTDTLPRFFSPSFPFGFAFFARHVSFVNLHTLPHEKSGSKNL